MGQRKNPTPKPNRQPTGHLVSGQVPHLAARPGEAAKGGILMDVISYSTANWLTSYISVVNIA